MLDTALLRSIAHLGGYHGPFVGYEGAVRFRVTSVSHGPVSLVSQLGGYFRRIADLKEQNWRNWPISQGF